MSDLLHVGGTPGWLGPSLAGSVLAGVSGVVTAVGVVAVLVAIDRLSGS